MSDTLETNLPEVENAGKLEEANVPEVTPEITVSDMETEDSTDTVASGAVGKLSKEEILSKLSDLVEVSVEESRSEIESLKQAYYKIRRNEVEELKKTFLENGGDEKDFSAPVDEIETQIKNLLNVYKEKRAALVAEEERVKEANYALKLQLIEQLKQLTESQEDFNKLYNDFKDIQNRWKEVKAVPQEFANELWKNYQIYSEKFYDIIKINNQFRDYDFKKNLELKTALCETVEKLEEEPDIISAFHQLQKLHQQWKEIGPVSKELREELWTRFKNASTAINKKHQAHFEGLKSREQENLDAKTAICEEIEAIDMDALKTFKDWEEMNKQVIALQEKWKTIGFAPKKANVKIFERFRAACDAYFNRKNDFYKSIKNDMERNLDLKKALCEKAEALKDSTDWKDSTDKLIALQKEWKTIGSVARKHSDAIWKRFISACDYFFEQKNKNVSSQKSVEQDNLAAKKQLIEKVNSLDESLKADQAVSVLKGLIAEWNTIGHVPFKEKDKVYKEFHDAVDKQFDRLKVGQAERKMQSFRSSITDMNSGEKGKNKLYGERERLMRYYERLKTEVQTYENNIGFLSVSSKGGSGLVKEMERKIENLKEEMALTVKKIDAIDENLE